MGAYVVATASAANHDMCGRSPHCRLGVRQNLSRGGIPAEEGRAALERSKPGVKRGKIVLTL